MKFRKTTEQDIDSIMNIVRQAQEFFRTNHIEQWLNNYPNPEIFQKDIQHGYSYVLEEAGQILGTAMISFDGEKTYNKIYNGDWLTHGEYAVIHRLAVDSRFKGSGISSEIITLIEKMCLDKGVRSIKVDTHEKNIPMQRLLQKNDFTYCGDIYLEDKSKRVAFEKRL
ncbi:GNAT family N-acetyltransferase [Heyndrickxia acidicola]|uniref:GNAT family N-acetyltransferase n=1 Tax=Heyndrickxia acidicola TaxID=209389 RepID=A0ABU6MJA7_9BACI|nr:GNAT family N-acetyltransferase [Heyndrickxia acidicola]MED1203312.1 GNAT family N-acetyltransferase [Heyndrickxia acidicola]